MASYSLNATNSTAQGWHFALYQQQPEEQGLKTVAWKVLSLSKPQPNPTTGSIPWSLSYQVTVPQHQENVNTYVGGLSYPAQLGYKYELYVDAGYNQIREVGLGTEGYIDFLNNTSAAENMGLMVGGTLMSMQENVAGNATAQFQISPDYYLGLYTQLTQGAFVSSDSVVTPVKIQFPSGQSTATVNAKIQDGQVIVSGPSYS